MSFRFHLPCVRGSRVRDSRPSLCLREYLTVATESERVRALAVEEDGMASTPRSRARSRSAVDGDEEGSGGRGSRSSGESYHSEAKADVGDGGDRRAGDVGDIGIGSGGGGVRNFSFFEKSIWVRDARRRMVREMPVPEVLVGDVSGSGELSGSSKWKYGERGVRRENSLETPVEAVDADAAESGGLRRSWTVLVFGAVARRIRGGGTLLRPRRRPASDDAGMVEAGSTSVLSASSPATTEPSEAGCSSREEELATPAGGDRGWNSASPLRSGNFSEDWVVEELVKEWWELSSEDEDAWYMVVKE